MLVNYLLWQQYMAVMSISVMTSRASTTPRVTPNSVQHKMHSTTAALFGKIEAGLEYWPPSPPRLLITLTLTGNPSCNFSLLLLKQYAMLQNGVKFESYE